MPSRLRRAILLALAVATCIVLIGATYQGIATALERRQYRHPGKLVDLGGHQLHLHCTGEGGPTVVLEAPALGMSSTWGRVQPLVAAGTRVCSYDRAGLGWSEAGDGSYQPEEAARQLTTLLERAGERGPYVLVGLDLGAALARLEAARLGDQAAAVLLFDLPAPGSTGTPANDALQVLPLAPWLARAGLLRASRMLAAQAAGLPEEPRGALATFLNRPDHLTRAGSEVAHWDATVAAAHAAKLAEGTQIVEHSTGGMGGIAFLAGEQQATATARIILDVVGTRQEQ